MLLIQPILAQRPHAARAFANFYSTVSGLSRTNWRTGGHPAPQPAVLTDADGDPPRTDKQPTVSRKPPRTSTPREFAAHRAAMKKAFPEGWSPPRRLSRDAMDALRSLHAADPDRFTTPVLANKFLISPEAVRRILKSKWVPTTDQRAKLAERERKHKQGWLKQKRLEESEKLSAIMAEIRRREKKEREDEELVLK